MTTPPITPTMSARATTASSRDLSSDRALSQIAVTSELLRSRRSASLGLGPGLHDRTAVQSVLGDARRLQLATVHDLAVPHLDDPIGRRRHLVVVGHEQDGLAIAMQPAEELHDLGPA